MAVHLIHLIFLEFSVIRDHDSVRENQLLIMAEIVEAHVQRRKNLR